MRNYTISVVSEYPIPKDVLIEHIAVALRDFNFAGKVGVAMVSETELPEREHEVAHPFDNPSNVVFDDDVQLEAYTGPNAGTHNEGSFLPADPYPLTTRVIDALKGNRESRS